ncbi:CorA family divalent cation transporter [uncultured Nostoc sp.]|uniref:CorA family divalent cation transporter n=1 Tax=uncultured Nostoc sp. TaxID=340711 RepID=UPI0035CA9924
MSGFYGMNFKYMSELEQPWAYPAGICVMALIVIGSIVYAKKTTLVVASFRLQITALFRG